MKGILLFVHITGISKLALRYPPILRGEVSPETMKQFELRSELADQEEATGVWDDAYYMPSVNLVGFIPVRDRHAINKPFEVQVNETAFVGHPMTFKQKHVLEEEEESSIGSLNVVFAVNRKAMCSEKMEMLAKCVYQLGCVLKREEERQGYLSQQCQVMFKERDAWLRAQSLPAEERPSHADLSDALMQCSSLARELRKAYVGLSETGFSYVQIANWISLSLSVNSMASEPTFPLRPFQAMLITSPSTKLPAVASADLVRFIQACKPSKSFQDMQMELNLPLAQVYRMAAHIMYWRIGKIVSTMKTQNVYCINPNCSITEELIEQFGADFPTLSLLDQLKRFSTAKPVKDHLPEIAVSHKVFSEVLVWFLRKNIVIQLFTFLLLSIPTTKVSLVEEEKSPSKHMTKEEDLRETGRAVLTEEELEHINEVSIAGTPLDLLFKRLCYYARGRHHIDEIVWRENMLHEDVENVLSNPKYSCIVTFQTEAAEI